MLVAGFSVRGAVESLRRLGKDKIIAVDFFGDWDLLKLSREVRIVKSSKELKEVLLSFRDEKIIYTSVLENDLGLLKLVEDRVLGNPVRSVRLVRPGRYWWELAWKLGIKIPRISEEPMSSGRWLLKPYRSGGGRGIRFWKRGESLKRGYYLQEFIEGESLSFLFLANGREFLPLGYTKQLIGFKDLGGDDFKWCGNIYPYRLSRSLKEKVEDWVGRLVEITGLRGLNGIDMVLSEEGPYFIEVNPRYTASMELWERAHGISVLKMHLQACCGEIPKLKAEEPVGFYVKGILYAEKPLTGFKCEKMWERGFRDITRSEEVVPKGRPVCSIFSYGSTEEEALKKLLEEKRWFYERGIDSEGALSYNWKDDKAGHNPS